jgi:hypothetical protein
MAETRVWVSAIRFLCALCLLAALRMAVGHPTGKDGLIGQFMEYGR